MPIEWDDEPAPGVPTLPKPVLSAGIAWDDDAAPPGGGANWWERIGIAQPGSPLAEKGFGGMVSDWPREIVDYALNTPSILEQSAENRKQVEAAGGMLSEEGMRLSLQDPMLFGFTPGEGIMRAPIPGRAIPGGPAETFATRPAAPPAVPAGARVPPEPPVAPTAGVAIPESPGAAAGRIKWDEPAPGFVEHRVPPPIMAPTRGATAPLQPPASGIAGNINLSRIDSPEAVKNVIRMDAELAGGDITARRGVIPLQATADMARDMGMTPGDLAKRMQGQAFNAEQAVAARNLLVQSATHVFELSKRAYGGSDAELAAFNTALTRHRAIQEQVAGMTAEAGRALSSFRILAQSQDRAAALKRITEMGGGRQRLEDLASAIATLQPDEVGAFVKNAYRATTRDKLQFAWINALVSGPQTHAVNMLSNTLTALWSLPETALAAGIGGVRRVFGGKGDYIAFGEPMARGTGMILGARDGLIAAGRALRTGAARDLTSKVDLPGPQQPLGRIGGVTVGLPTRFLMAEDELFKSIAYRSEINARALRIARVEGLQGQALAQRVADLRANPTPAMTEAAEKFATYQTFQSDLGAFGQWLMRGRNMIPGAVVVLPFVKTPANILKFAIERSPLGVLLKDARANLAGKNGAAARDTQLARMLLGSTIGVTVASLAAEGKITGSGPSDPNQRNLMRANGWQPYSVNVGGTWYAYNRLDPLGLLMGISADLAELGTAVSEAEADKIGAMVVGSISENLVNKTYLRGLSEFVAAVNDPQRYGEFYIRNLVSTVVPTGVAQVARTMDPVLRDARTILDSLKARIPGMSDELPAKLNLFGEPIVREGGVGPDLLSPLWTSQGRNDPVVNEMLRLEVTPSMPKRKIGSVDLTPEQYWQYVEMAGKPLKAALDRLVTGDVWQRLPDLARRELIERLVRDTRQQAADQMMARYPEIARQSVQQKLEEIRR